MKSVVKRTIILGMIIVGVFLSLRFSSYAKYDGNDDAIDKLFDQREMYILKGNRVSGIDKKLKKNGVKQVSDEYVKKNYPEAYISVYPEDKSKNSLPLNGISKPKSSKVQFYLYIGKVKYKGKWYQTERLVAQPKYERESKLYSMGTVALYANPGFKKALRAGTAEFLKASVGYTKLGNILTIYDVGKAFVGGFSKSTRIENIKAIYVWSYTTTATFIYVKPKSRKNIRPELTYITTKCSVLVDYTSPRLILSSDKNVYPWHIYGKKIFTTGNYPSKTCRRAAVKNYANNWGQTRKTVPSIRLTGIEGKEIATLSPVSPAFPAHVM